MCLFSLYCPYNEEKMKLEGAAVRNAMGGGGKKTKNGVKMTKEKTARPTFRRCRVSFLPVLLYIR